MANDGILIKSNTVLDGLIKGEYPDILREMTFVVIQQLRMHGAFPTLTSSFREGDSGVHGFYRALDFRTWELSTNHIKSILEYVNSRYQYDPERPEKAVLVYHDSGRGPHLHLQSHPNTNTVKKGVR